MSRIWIGSYFAGWAVVDHEGAYRIGFRIGWLTMSCAWQKPLQFIRPW